MRGNGPIGSTTVRLSALALVLLLLGAACSTGERVPDLSGSEEVSFPSADGVRLEGRLFGGGTSAVVLSHMRPADQRSWFDFATRLAGDGYIVLTYNFRGYCPGGEAGCSDGEADIGAIWQDVLGAVDFVRSRGATSVSFVGASMGGTAALVAAARAGADVGVVITLSAPTSIEGLVVDREVLARVSAAKLFVAGVGDSLYAQAAETLFTIAPQPKALQILPSDDHGTDLLNGGQGEVTRRLIENQLEQYGA